MALLWGFAPIAEARRGDWLPSALYGLKTVTELSLHLHLPVHAGWQLQGAGDDLRAHAAVATKALGKRFSSSARSAVFA